MQRFNYLIAGISACIGACMVISCSNSDRSSPSTHVKGKITVADSVDSSGNYSGIGVLIMHRDSAGSSRDTLYHHITDSAGVFAGDISLKDTREYLFQLERNGRVITRTMLILAHDDTLSVAGQLPGFEQTAEFKSREYAALQMFERVDRNFKRFERLVPQSGMSEDSLRDEIGKWSDIYWQVYDREGDTYAGKLAAAEAIKILYGWDNEAMMDRIKQVYSDDYFMELAALYGSYYLSREKGLDHVLAYLDTLSSRTQTEEVKMSLHMNRIKLLYDSARTEEAFASLERFREQYSEDQYAQKWSEMMGYDLTHLSPGDSIPSFSFRDNGKEISKNTLSGTPYILEISRLSNLLYQEQYDRTVVIHSIYKNFGLQVLTIPLDQSQTTVDAFFEERVRPWPVAPTNAFDIEELIDRFNIQYIPTRFLVDRQGNIVRKYVGREYKDVIQGIQLLLKDDEPAL